MTGTPLYGWSTVLFDLDGTLADTVELILRCFRHTAARHLGEVPADERFLEGIGRPLRDQFQGFTDDAAAVAAMVETYTRFQRSIHDDLVEPFPGALDVLDALSAAGVPVGIVTSKRREMAERTLDHCGLRDRYDVLVGADDVTHGKPDPEPVRLALELLGLPDSAATTLFVGDSPYDIRAGREAGTRTAAALWGPFSRGVLEAESPDFTLGALEDVLSLSPAD